MNGRFFGGQKVVAYVLDRKPKFKRNVGSELDEESEKAYQNWLEQE